MKKFGMTVAAGIAAGAVFAVVIALTTLLIAYIIV